MAVHFTQLGSGLRAAARRRPRSRYKLQLADGVYRMPPNWKLIVRYLVILMPPEPRAMFLASRGYLHAGCR